VEEGTLVIKVGSFPVYFMEIGFNSPLEVIGFFHRWVDYLWTTVVVGEGESWYEGMRRKKKELSEAVWFFSSVGGGLPLILVFRGDVKPS
jgi:hypothetical protein